MKRRDAMKGIILFSLGTSMIYSCTDPYQAVKDLNLEFIKPDKDQLTIIDSISKIVVPLQAIPALAQHTALPFVLKMINDVAKPKDRDAFLVSYQSFDLDVYNLTEKRFSKMELEEQTNFLIRLNKREEGLPKHMQSFFDVIKGESLKYLTTSEYVQRKVNYYEMAPGRFRGDVLLSELQNANSL